MKKNLLIALWFTLVTTVMFGVLYPLAITDSRKCSFRPCQRTTDPKKRKDRRLENYRTKLYRAGLFPFPAVVCGNRIRRDGQQRFESRAHKQDVDRASQGRRQKVQAENPKFRFPSIW